MRLGAEMNLDNLPANFREMLERVRRTQGEERYHVLLADLAARSDVLATLPAVPTRYSEGRKPTRSEAYLQYLQSDEWKARSDAAKARAGYRCQLCNSTAKIETHHRTYERLGHEDDADLIVLCDDCHKRFHNKLEKN